MYKIKDITDEALDRLTYDENSPSGLIWKIDIFDKNGKLHIRKGKNVGTKLFRKNKKPCGWQVNVLNMKFQAHRIVWAIFNDKPNVSLIIDHIDGNPFNNKINNLRLVETKENNWNTARREDQKDNFLPNGIIFREVPNGGRTGVNPYFIVHWQEDGICKSKHIPIHKLGIIRAQYEAIKFRRSKEHHFSDRHGL